MEITTHCFEDSLTMVAITIHTKAIYFFLFSCSEKTLNFTFRSDCLKVLQDLIFECWNSILPCLEFLCFFILVPARIQTCGHMLTHRIRIELTSINTNEWFTQIVWFLIKGFFCYCFHCENNRGTTGHIFPYFFKQVTIPRNEWVKRIVGWLVWTDIGYIR